jgi:hypothetical protein
MGAAVDGGLWLWMRIWIVSGFVGYIESIRMVFQRSECSSYRCDGSFRKLCSATCICAFTTLGACVVHALCDVSAFPTSVLFLRAFPTLLHEVSAFRTLFTEGARAKPEKKWGALGACHALNALNARIFFSRCRSVTRHNAADANVLAIPLHSAKPPPHAPYARNRIYPTTIRATSPAARKDAAVRTHHFAALYVSNRIKPRTGHALLSSHLHAVRLSSSSSRSRVRRRVRLPRRIRR